MTKTVLVIEDDQDLNFLFTSILGRNYEVDSALDGREGVQKLSESSWDCVVLDLHLPDVSGEEIYAMLERRGDADRVLICSADARLVQNYIMRGVNAVTKPIPMALLNSLVSRVVEGVPLAGGFFMSPATALRMDPLLCEDRIPFGVLSLVSIPLQQVLGFEVPI